MASSTEKRITAKMVLDSTGYNSKLKGLNAEMKKHQSELKLASQGIKSFGANSEKLKSIQGSLAKQVELHSKKVDVYRKAIEKTKIKLEENIKARDRLKSSLTKANEKYKDAVKMYGKESEEAKKAKEEVNKLSEQHKKAERAVETNARQVQKYETNMNNANTQMVRTQGELRRVNEQLDRSNNKWLKASESLKKSSEKLKRIGSAVSGAGDKILKITAPLAVGGIASLKFATDFEDSIAKVSTIADTSQVPITGLRKVILKLSDDTGIASTEIANNVYDAISAGQKTGDAVNFVKNSTKLAKAGFAEAGQSLDLLTTIMNSYGIKSSEVTKVSDILIQTQNKGKVTVGELSSSMGKLIPTANANKVQLNQVATGYALMTAKGIKAAESTTYMNSMFNEMGKSGTTASKAIKAATGKTFPELIKSGKTVGDVLNEMNKYAKKNHKSLADMFGSAEAGKASLILSTNAGKDFNNMLGEMGNSTGATDKAFKKVENTTGERFRKSINKLKNTAIKFGDAISPMLDKGSKLLSKITNKLNGLSKEQLESIAKWGMMAIATGGALKIIGGGISTIGSIAGGLSKLTGLLGKTSVATQGASVATGVASKGIGALGLASKAGALLLNPWTLGIAGAGLAIYGLHKHLSKEAIPSVNLFADRVVKSQKINKNAVGGIAKSTQEMSIKISKETKKAVSAYMDLDKGAEKSLTDLYVNGTKISADTSKSLINIYDKMGQQIKHGMDNHYKEQVKSMKDFFKNSKDISKKEQEDMLNGLKKHNDNQKEEINKCEKRIKEIMDKASKGKRELKKEEQQEINKLQEKLRTNAVKSLSKEEVESKVILERLKGYGTRVTAEQASNVIKNAEKQRKGSVDKANKQYEQTVRNIVKMRDESHTITADQADKLIKEAERQKTDSITKAKEMKETVVEKIKEMNKDSLKDIDESDGHIKTKWEKLKSWFSDNPITRWIKTKEEQREKREKTGHNWTGTNYWRGGLTTLNEKGYELYDLPRATRVYNHEASEELVKQTAEDVATKVAKGMLNKFNGGNGVNVTQYINSPTPSPSEIARQTKNSLRELSLNF